jgi:hypothetical protein
VRLRDLPAARSPIGARSVGVANAHQFGVFTSSVRTRVRLDAIGQRIVSYF